MNQQPHPAGVSAISVLEGVVASALTVSRFLTAGGRTQIPKEELIIALEQMPWASTVIGLPVFAITSALLLVISIVFFNFSGSGILHDVGVIAS